MHELRWRLEAISLAKIREASFRAKLADKNLEGVEAALAMADAELDEPAPARTGAKAPARAHPGFGLELSPEQEAALARARAESLVALRERAVTKGGARG